MIKAAVLLTPLIFFLVNVSCTSQRMYFTNVSKSVKNSSPCDITAKLCCESPSWSKGDN